MVNVAHPYITLSKFQYNFRVHMIKLEHFYIPEIHIIKSLVYLCSPGSRIISPPSGKG